MRRRLPPVRSGTWRAGAVTGGLGARGGAAYVGAPRSPARTPLYGTSIRVGSHHQRAVRRPDRRGQFTRTGQEAVAAAGGRAALRDRPHDERLAAARVTGDEDTRHVGLEVGVAGDVAALVELQTELVHETVLAVRAREAHGQGHQLGGDLALRARLRGQLAVDELDLAEVQPLDVAVLVALEVGRRDGVDPLAALLVRGGDLVEHREGRPRLVRGTVLARPRHDLQLGDRGRAL